MSGERARRRIVRKNYLLDPSQTYDDLVNDIRIITSKVNKPIIFQGHANILFKNDDVFKNELKDSYTRISSREIIDNAKITETEQNNRIIINEIFGDNYYQERWRDVNSSYHYSDTGYKLIVDKFNALVRTIR